MTTYLDQVLDCFARMDIKGLRVLLKDEYTYYNVHKAAFLERLGELFEEFKADDVECCQLEIYPGAFGSLEYDQFRSSLGYRFIGFGGAYFDLGVTLEKDENGQDDITDIYPCDHLITNARIEELGESRTLWVYEDDRVTFNRDANYQILVKFALDANSRWIETFENKKITLSDIHTWLRMHETTYFEIRDFNFDQDSIWKWDKFLRLYYNLDKFVNFLQDFRHDVDRLNKVGEMQLDETALMPWILDIERRMEESYYYEIYGCVFEIDQLGSERKITIGLIISFLLDEVSIAPTEKFLAWFEYERKKLLIKYFSLTQGEYDDFLENSDDIMDICQVISQLSYHLDIRDKFRKQGIYIPYGLGVVIDPEDLWADS